MFGLFSTVKDPIPNVLSQDPEKLQREIDKLLKTVENNTSDAVSSVDDKEIEHLLSKLTSDLTERYKDFGDIDTDVFEYFALEVVKKHLQNDDVIDAVREVIQDEFQRNLEILDEPSTQQRILNEINPTANINELSTDELLQYKELEYNEFKALFFGNTNTDETFTPTTPTCEEISKKLTELGSVDNSIGQKSKLKAQYAGQCKVQIQNILCSIIQCMSSIDEEHAKTIDHFERVLSHNENLDSTNYTRHEFYERILNATSSPKSDIVLKIEEWLRELISEHWELFLAKFDQKLTKSKEKILVEIIAEKKIDLQHVEELKYQISNAIFEGAITADVLHKMSCMTEHFSLKQFLIQEGDKIHLLQMNADYFNRSPSNNKDIKEAKNFIVDEYERYCGVLDRSVKATYVETIRLYLERFDWLLVERNNVNAGERLKIWKKTKQKVETILQNPDVPPERRGLLIEAAVAAQINGMIFGIASGLPTDFLQYSVTHSSTFESDFKRNYKTPSFVTLDELFTISGDPVRKEWNNLNDKTVVVSIDNDEVYYGLPDDTEGGSDRFKKLFIEFFEEMSALYRKHKLQKLRCEIKAYNRSKCCENLIKICRELIFYCTLTAEHIDCKSDFARNFQSFLENFTEVIEHLLIHQKDDQNILKQLKIGMDMFGKDVIENRLGDCGSEDKETLTKIVSNLKELMKNLSFKVFKESGYQLLTEEKIQFSTSTDIKRSTSEKLLNSIRSTISTVLELRMSFPPKSPSEIFKTFNKLINKNDVKWTKQSIPSDEEISKWLTFWENQKHKILLPNISVDKFFEDIHDPKKKFWEEILSKIERNFQEQFIIHIFKQYLNKFSKTDVERLYFASNVNAECKPLILQFFTDKILEEKLQILSKKMTDAGKTLTEVLRAVISNAFSVFEIVEHSNKLTNPRDLFEHLEVLVGCVPDDPSDDNLNKTLISLEEIEKSFILRMLQLKGISESMVIPHDATEAVVHLQLFLQLPDSCLTDQKELLKSFVGKLIDRQWDADIQTNDMLNILIKDLIFRFYTLYPSEISGTNKESLPLSTDDVIDVLQRYYDNLTPEKFIIYVKEIFQSQTKGLLAGLYCKISEMVSNKSQTRHSKELICGHVSLMYDHEKEHLNSLLRFEKIERREKKSIEDEKEVENLEKLLEKSNYCKEIMQCIHTSPSNMWEEELIELRTKKIEYFLINKFAGTDIGLTRLSDFMNAFLFTHKQMGRLSQAISTLELFCINVSKFKTIEQIKQCLISLTRNVDLMKVDAIIDRTVGHQLTLELLFIQIDAGDSPKLKAAIDKLKILLSYRKFEDVSEFCRAILVHAREQQNLDDFCKIIELLIECKIYDRNEILEDLVKKDFFLWTIDLQKVLLLDKLKGTMVHGYSDKEQRKLVDLLIQLKDVKGIAVQQTLLEKIQKLQTNSEDLNAIKDLMRIIHKIIDKPINCNILERLPTDLNQWKNILFSQDHTSGKLEPLTLNELVELMKDGDKLEVGGINETAKPCIVNDSETNDSLIEVAITRARKLNKSMFLVASTKSIDSWEEDDILRWTQSFSNSSLSDKVFSWRNSSSNMDIVAELLAVIIRAVVLYDHYPTGPRNTQLMAVLLFLDGGGEGKGRLGNIYTGEGKTLITVMLATCLALKGNIVDVVTSSKVLAVRDSKPREIGSKEGYQNFFKMFGLTASNNCDEKCEQHDTGEEERRSRYSNCQIIYGETGYFQRDILLTKFFRKEIRPAGNSIGNVLILDEVDSMMIDNAAKTLYISHNITDMSYVRDVFIQIWAAVNSCEERNYSEANVNKIVKYINEIIDPSHPGELKITIPSTLKDFVDHNLRTWIESAYQANFTNENDSYIIGDYGSQQENEVIIMDKDTGVEQMSTKWSNGFHQFIQLKHSGKMSDESLKAVFISNSGYFQMYPKLYGMTGTVGGIEERSLLRKVYEIDFFEVPRFKEYKFEYDFESESVACSPPKWLDNIIENVQQTMNSSLKYDEKYVTSMNENLKREKSCLSKLTEDIDNMNRKMTNLEKERTECDQIVRVCEMARKFAQQLHTLCEKGDPERKINGVVVEIKNLKKKSPNVILEHLEAFEKVAQELCELKTDFHLLEFVIADKMKSYIFATLSNEHKEKLKILNEEIKKLSGNLKMLKDAKKRSETDKLFYLEESKKRVGSERKDCRRAILIICENIHDVEKIEREIFNMKDGGEYKTYKYDRAYRKFDLTCLEKGDIVIATNIAGRGTDLEVSSEVEANGGLHVILSYMPKNFRIEKQAFGRTARAGNKGTGTYIVFHPGGENDDDIDISQLKTERNKEESRRLRVVLNEQLPKIRLEDELFNQFTILQQNIKQRIAFTSIGKFIPHKDLPSYSKTPLDLQLAGLHNKWALWLNKMNENITKVNERGTEVVVKDFVKFKSEITKKLNQTYGLIDEPGELTKLGRLYMDNKQFSDALSCFNHIIKYHPLCAGIAYYYSAFCIVHLESGYDARRKAKYFLKKSLHLLEDEMNRILSRNQILKSINELSRSRGKATHSNLFAKQNEGLTQLLSVHINAIYSAIGSSITPENFIGPGVTPDQAQRIYDSLLTKNCTIKNFRISKKVTVVEQNDSTGALANISFKGKDTHVEFPHTFDYCKQLVLDDLSKSLKKSRNNKWWYKDREKTAASFEGMIYTKAEFEKEMKEFIVVEEMIEIDEKVKDKLLGSLSDSIYCGHGGIVKKLLTSDFLKIDRTVLVKMLDGTELTDDDFVDLKVTKSDVRNICLDRVEYFNNTGYFMTNVLLEELKNVGQQSTLTTNSIEFTNFLSALDFKVTRSVSLEYLTKLMKTKAPPLNDKNIKEIIWHLEHYIKLNIDHNFLKTKFDVKNESIFFGRKSAIREFCLGARAVEITNGKKIQLLHNASFSKYEIVESLKMLTAFDNASRDHQRNFDDLISHLGFNGPDAMQAIRTYKRYHFADPSHMEKIKVFLQSFNLITSKSNEKETLKSIDQLNLEVDQRLGMKSKEIKEILKSHVQKANFHFRRETFNIGHEAFGILRAILTDAKLITNSVVHLIKGIDDQQIGLKLNAELENILMNMYNGSGVISDKDLILKDAKTGSQELFSRLLNLKILKPAKVYFPLGRAQNIPNFIGGNFWKDRSDPIKRIEYFTNAIEEVIVDVFQTKRKDDTKHMIVDALIGFGTESKNKELNEKVTTITNVIKHLAGTLNIHPEVKMGERNLRSILSSERMPPEILEYIHKSFDIVVDYNEDKPFDWDCFLCGMIGVGQIVVGVALEILSGGSFHFIAQGLISEGIGDIVFAIQSRIEGNFSWKAYSKHKVQSIVLTVLTCGVGSYLARGANVAKMGVGLATKTAIFKAVAQTVVLESCTAVCTAIVNVGADEISKLVMDELANEHFVKYFEQWIKESNSYEQKRNTLEAKLNGLYKKFGVEATSQSVDACLDNTLNQLMSGTIGAKVMNQLSGVVNSISRSFSMAGNRFKLCGNNKAKLFGEIASLIRKTAKVTNFVQSFAQLCEICKDFNDAMIREIETLEKTLLEQEKKGILKVNRDEIASRSFTEQTQSVLRKTEEKMRIAFLAKIKNGFLQPVISDALHKGIRPIQNVLLSPFANATQKLEAHIEVRAQQKKRKLMEQTPHNIVPLTTAQKKALELRGDIIQADNATPEMLSMELSNFPGQTIESMKEKHGSNMSFFVSDGQLIGVIPSYKQYWENIDKAKGVGTFYMEAVALNNKRNIEFVHGTNTHEHQIINGGGGSTSKNYRVMLIEEQEGDPGHLVPAINLNGNWVVVTDIKQPDGTENVCAAQCFLYLQEYEKTGDQIKAKKFAENVNNIKNFNKELTKFAKSTRQCKDAYHSGITVRDEVFVGKESDISKIERDLTNLDLNDEKYSALNRTLTQVTNNSSNVNKFEKMLLRLQLARDLEQLKSDSSITEDVVNSYLRNIKRLPYKHFYDPNCNEVQIYTMESTNRNLSEGGNVDLVKEQWAFIPFNSQEGENVHINCLREAMEDLKKYGNVNLARLHLTNARGGGPTIQENLALGTKRMNSHHYHGFEKLFLNVLNKHRGEAGALFIKTKIEYPPCSNVGLAIALHVCIGTTSTNKVVQKNLDSIFRIQNKFNASNRSSGRIDYRKTITHSGRKECKEDFSSSSET